MEFFPARVTILFYLFYFLLEMAESNNTDFITDGTNAQTEVVKILKLESDL